MPLDSLLPPIVLRFDIQDEGDRRMMLTTAREISAFNISLLTVHELVPGPAFEVRCADIETMLDLALALRRKQLHRA